MGTFQVTIEIGDPQGQRWERLEALVDTGSTFTWVPSEMLRRLGVQPLRRARFETAEGQATERDVGETRVRYGGQANTTLVVFADDDTEPLLGAYTLEGFLLAADPVNRRLLPVVGLAKTSRRAG